MHLIVKYALPDASATYYDDLVVLQEAYRLEDDSKATLHYIVWEAVEKMFPHISKQKVEETEPQPETSTMAHLTGV